MNKELSTLPGPTVSSIKVLIISSSSSLLLRPRSSSSLRSSSKKASVKDSRLCPQLLLCNKNKRAFSYRVPLCRLITWNPKHNLGKALMRPKQWDFRTQLSNYPRTGKFLENQGPDSKCFRRQWPWGLCCNCSADTAAQQQPQTTCTRWTWLCCSRTLFTEMSSGPFLIHRP